MKLLFKFLLVTVLLLLFITLVVLVLTTHTLTKQTENTGKHESRDTVTDYDQVYSHYEDKIYYGNNQVVSEHFNNAEMQLAYRDTEDVTLMRRFLRVLCIGTIKSGTQALLEFLDLHPQIRSVSREILYFKYGHKFDVNGLEKYLKKMPYSKKYELTFEKSPQFTSVASGIDRRIPERIHFFDGSIKLLFVVRNPIDRALSEYLHNERAQLNKNRTFHDLTLRHNGEVNMFYVPLQNSLYFNILKVWYEYFSKDQIHIVDGENLKSNPSQELAKIEEFLNLTHILTEDLFYFNTTKGFHCYRTIEGSTVNKRCLWPTKGNTHPPIEKHLKIKLKHFFTAHNEKFYKLIGKKFPWN